MAKLTFEEVQEKLDDLGIILFDHKMWDIYEVYPRYNRSSAEFTQDRSEESLQEAFKKGLQMAKKAGKFSKITFDQPKIIAKRKISNPDDTYSLWKDLSSRDSTKARKAALALKQHFAGKSKFSDFWSIIGKENSLTVSEIKAKIESVIKKTSSGVRVNPIRKVVRKLSNPRIRLYEIASKFGKSHAEIVKIAEKLEIPVLSAMSGVDDADAYLIEEYLLKKSPKKRNPQTIFGFFPFETKLSLSDIELLIIQADEVNELMNKKKPLTADKKLEKLEKRFGKKLANQVVAWRKYNNY